MEFHIEFIVVIQLLIKIETIYETGVLGEVPIWFVSWGKSRYFGCWGKSRYGFIARGSPDMVVGGSPEM